MSGHTIDADTLALWRANSVSGTTLPDATGNGYDMTIVGGTPATVAGITGGNGITLTSSIYAELATPTPFITAFTGLTGWTVEAWIRRALTTGDTSKRYFFSCAGSFSGDVGTDNAVASCGVATAGAPNIFWERNFNDSGSPSNGFNACDQVATGNHVPQGIWTHVAWRRNADSLGSSSTDFFYNGQLMHSFASKKTAGISTPITTHYAHIGRFYRSTNTEGWTGDVDEVRLSNIPRTDAEILASFMRVYGSSPSGATPTISNLYPADGGAMGKLTTLRFDVTTSDAVPFLKTFVWASFGDSDAVEMIYDGTAFTPFYASSAVTNTKGGKHFEVTRVNGWPSKPRLSVSAVTTQGKVL